MERIVMPDSQPVIHETPIKLIGDQTITPNQAQECARVALTLRTEVPDDRAGTCSDERPRVGVISGEPIVEPRRSVYGASNVYGLVVAELSGQFVKTDLTSTQRLHQVTETIESKKLTSGGHTGCAANGSFQAILGAMADNMTEITNYAASDMSALGADYDPDIMADVLVTARAVYESGVYESWTEAVLADELGDKAGHAIEKLADVPHSARFFVRQKKDHSTVDQTELSEHIAGGAFIYDDPYAGEIERAVVAGDDHSRADLIGRHIREAHIAAVNIALPNPELHQIDLI